MKKNPNMDDAFELGAIAGQKHALGLVAGRCSAASAEHLRRIRQEKKYKVMGLSWEEFCTKRLGISRPFADKTIRLLDEFGPGYFALSQVMHLTADEYRRIAPSVSDTALLHAGETIAISAENAPRLAAAIEELQRSAEAAEPPADTKEVDLERLLRRAERALQSALDDFEILNSRQLELAGRLRLQSALGSRLPRLQLLQASLRI